MNLTFLGPLLLIVLVIFVLLRALLYVFSAPPKDDPFWSEIFGEI